MAFVASEVGDDFEDFVANSSFRKGGSGHAQVAATDGQSGSGKKQKPRHNQQRKAAAPSREVFDRMRRAISDGDRVAVETLLADG